MPIGAQIFPMRYGSVPHRSKGVTGDLHAADTCDVSRAKGAAPVVACSGSNGHLLRGFDQNTKLFDEALAAQTRLLEVSVAAFALQLCLAVSAAAAAIVLVLWLEAALAIVLGAIAVLSAGVLSVGRPMRCVERHLGIVSMLHVIRNAYMTGMMRMPDSPTLQSDIERLKSSAIRDLTQLLMTVDKRGV